MPSSHHKAVHRSLPAAGFHSYVQDVAPGSAGLVLAVTNSCGTLVGIGGNLATGHLAASRWGYAGRGGVGSGWGGVGAVLLVHGLVQCCMLQDSVCQLDLLPYGVPRVTHCPALPILQGCLR